MTAVAGRYDSSRPLPEDDGDEEQYRREQESFGDGPFEIYLHGNVAMLLYKKTKAEGLVKVVITSTKGRRIGSPAVRIPLIFCSRRRSSAFRSERPFTQLPILCNPQRHPDSHVSRGEEIRHASANEPHVSTEMEFRQ